MRDKDCTGVAVALVLQTLVVEHEAVIANYSASAGYRQGHQDGSVALLRRDGYDDGVIEGMLGSPAWVMTSMLRRVRSRVREN